MRFFDNGAFYTVQVFSYEVAAFADRWPCSGLPDSSVTFTFDSNNGDLVDIVGEADGMDSDAVMGLSAEAQQYAQRHKRFAGRHLPR